MFEFLKKKKKGKIPEFLDQIETIEDSMRASGVYAAVPYLEAVFDKLDDDESFKLTETQQESIQLYLDDIGAHVSNYYLELIKYECDEIILRATVGAQLSDEEENAKNLEYQYKVCTAEIERAEAELQSYELSDIDRIKLENELAELRERNEAILKEYKGK